MKMPHLIPDDRVLGAAMWVLYVLVVVAIVSIPTSSCVNFRCGSPIVGSQYRVYDANPFEPVRRVVILANKDDYVQYRYISAEASIDSMQKCDFVRIFRLME